MTVTHVFLVALCQLAGCSARLTAPQPESAPPQQAPHSVAVAARATAQPDGAPGRAPVAAPVGPSELSHEGTVSPSEPRSTGIPEAIWTELDVPGSEPALVWYRAGAPLFVVTHGAGGTAEWHCGHVHHLLDGRATLLCPRGKRRFARDPAQGYYYPDHLALRREVHALIERFEAVVAANGATRPYTYAGYSQGATMGALAFAGEGALFSQLMLVEGGYADWSNALVTRFQQSGGKAVLFVCGTKACHHDAQAAVQRLQLAKVRSKLAWARGAGHRPDGPVGQATSETLSFLLEQDPRWQGFTPMPEDNAQTRSNASPLPSR